MRSLFGLFLSFVLAFGSMSMAVAKGQMPNGQTITLCTSDGTTTVVLDANGQPTTAAPHLCPDCLSAGAAFALAPALRLAPPPGGFRAVPFAFARQTRPSLPRIAAMARGPPALFV
jgi:hypothetical protein